MNLEDDIQEWKVFSHLVPTNDMKFYDLHTLGRRDFDISFDWQSRTISNDVEEEAINSLRNETSRGDIIDLSNITFSFPDSLAKT